MANTAMGLALVFLLLVGAAFTGYLWESEHLWTMSSEERHAHLMEVKDQIVNEKLSTQQYRCCLKTPCAFCLTATPEGSCQCLERIMNGEAPCPECVGTILSGGGNPLLAEYFARALAAGLGSGTHAWLKEMMTQNYGIPWEVQR